MLYKYSASGTDQQLSEGTIEAVSEKMAEEALYRAGFKYVLNLEARIGPTPVHRLIPSLFGVKTQDIIDFSRQLASFLESGTTLHSGLKMLEEQAGKKSLKEVIGGIISGLEQGQSFSSSIKAYTEIFTYSYCQVIQSSEKTGELAKGLNQIADYMENRAAIADRVRRAMAYPIFVICLAIGVVVLLVTTVLPPILKLFDSFQADLPGITVFALNIISFLSSCKLQVLLASLIIAGIFVLLYKFPSGRYWIDFYVLKLPAIGQVLLEYNLGRICRTTSMLYKAGLTLPAIMEIVIRTTTGNSVVMNSLKQLNLKLMQGQGLARPMSEDSLFPPMMVRMVAVGEQTGTLDSGLDTLTAYFEGHAGKRIQALIGAIEPGLTVAIGLGIAFVLYSLIIPIYSIMGSMH